MCAQQSIVNCSDDRTSEFAQSSESNLHSFEIGHLKVLFVSLLERNERSLDHNWKFLRSGQEAMFLEANSHPTKEQYYQRRNWVLHHSTFFWSAWFKIFLSSAYPKLVSKMLHLAPFPSSILVIGFESTDCMAAHLH